MNLPETVVKNRKSYKILTPKGYQSFFGVNKIKKDKYIHLIFEDGNDLKCSLDHPLSTVDGIIKAKDLSKTTEVYTQSGGTFLKSYRVIKKEVELYDIVNSGDDHLYYSNNIVSHNCQFLGSVDTLISGTKLSTLSHDSPIQSNASLDVYAHPVKNHRYVITVDVARGVDLDYSAFVVTDVTDFPYRVVAKYRDNQIKPLLFPYKIHEVAKAYNEAYILCEINDIGDQVASALHYEFAYSNLLMCSQRGRSGQILGQGFSGGKTQMGVKMSKPVKKVGCINLKAIIESDKLLINDFDIISELTTFVQKYSSFEAEEGAHDDLVMCLVSLAWLITQDYFKEMTDNDVRKRLYEEKEEQLEQDIAPFGFILDGLSSEETQFVDNDGTVWHADEYGSMTDLWTYY